MDSSFSDEVNRFVEQGEWEKLKSLVLKEEEHNRAQIGLEIHSELDPLQVAALYKPQIAHRMLPRFETLDIFTRVLLDLPLDDVSDREFKTYVEGFSPLGIAVYRGKIDSAQMLLRRGDDPNRAQGRAGFYVWETDALQNQLARWTPLHIATLHGYLDQATQSIQMLCENDADLDAFNTYGAQAIHLAATHGWLANLQVLLDFGAMVDALTEPIDETIHRITGTPSHVPISDAGITPLMVAIQEGFLPVASFLLTKGADVNFRTSDGYSPLHFAACPWWDENADMIELLLAHGADKTCRNELGQYPYELAGQVGHKRSAALLNV